MQKKIGLIFGKNVSKYVLILYILSKHKTLKFRLASRVESDFGSNEHYSIKTFKKKRWRYEEPIL